MKITRFLLLLILFHPFIRNSNNINSDSTFTSGAPARGNNQESYYDFIRSMKNLYGELGKLRNIGKLNENNIKVINVNALVYYSQAEGIESILHRNSNEIIVLRNYLNNSADEKNIQIIKKIFNLNKLEVSDIIGVEVKNNGGADFYYYRQK